MPTIIFKPSHDCNLKCRFCYDRFNKKEDKSRMPVDTTIQILWKAIPELMERGPVEVIWHGGEPLLAGIDYFKQIFEEFKDLNVNWNVQTNGALFNQDWLDLFIKYHVAVGCSWDGNFDKEQGEHCWDYVAPLLKSSVAKGVLYTVTPENMTSIIPAYDFVHRYNGSVGFSYVFGENYKEEDYKSMAYYVAQLFDFLCQQDNADITRPFDEYLAWLTNSEVTLCEYGSCGNDWVGIQPNGMVTRCGRAWSKEFILGDALDPNFHFNQLDNNIIAAKIKDAKQQQFKHCQKCKYVWYCNNGCPSMCFNEKNEFVFNQAHCFYQKTLFDLLTSILKHHLQENSLQNQNIINAVCHSHRMEFNEWKNYMSHTI